MNWFRRRCPHRSPDGKRCSYRRGHDAGGQPHSWTLFRIGGFAP